MIRDSELIPERIYLGKLNIKHSSPDGVNTDILTLGATFIVGGQIKGQPMELLLIYPQGNFIEVSQEFTMSDPMQRVALAEKLEKWLERSLEG